MGLPCFSVLGSSGYLMAAEAPPPTRCRFKTTWDTSREAVFKCFTCVCFSTRFDNGIQEDVSPYCTHLVWRTLWLLLLFTPASGCKGDPSQRQHHTQCFAPPGVSHHQKSQRGSKAQQIRASNEPRLWFPELPPSGCSWHSEREAEWEHTGAERVSEWVCSTHCLPLTNLQRLALKE